MADNQASCTTASRKLVCVSANTLLKTDCTEECQQTTEAKGQESFLVEENPTLDTCQMKQSEITSTGYKLNTRYEKQTDNMVPASQTEPTDYCTSQNLVRDKSTSALHVSSPLQAEQYPKHKELPLTSLQSSSSIVTQEYELHAAPKAVTTLSSVVATPEKQTGIACPSKSYTCFATEALVHYTSKQMQINTSQLAQMANQLPIFSAVQQNTVPSISTSIAAPTVPQRVHLTPQMPYTIKAAQNPLGNYQPDRRPTLANILQPNGSMAKGFPPTPLTTFADHAFKPLQAASSPIQRLQQQVATFPVAKSDVPFIPKSHIPHAVYPQNIQTAPSIPPISAPGTDTLSHYNSHVSISHQGIAHPVHSLLPKVVSPAVTTTAQLPSGKKTSTIVQVMSTETTTTRDSSANVPPVQSSAVSCSVVPVSSMPVNQTLPCNSALSKPELMHVHVPALPVVIPNFQTAKVNAKKYPPRHYDFSTLQIGLWKLENKSGAFNLLITSRLKVIFTQRKFVYEFQLNSDGFQAYCQGHRQMACIEVPFVSVVAINISNGSPHEVLIEVDSPPSMYLGKQTLNSPSTGSALPTRYDTSKTVDLTGGQLSTVPYHKVTLTSISVRAKLEEFDPRFKALLAVPIIVDPNKRLSLQTQSVKPAKHKKAKENTPHPTAAKKRRSSSSSSSTPLNDICHCTTGCHSKRCACVKAEGQCSQGCKCSACKNPLNILANMGVDIAVAKKDICLMQNIYKITDLEKVLRERKVELPCCEEQIPLKEVCGDVVMCPDEECGGEFKFSWCDWSFCDDENRPRYHCPTCKRCGDYRDDHCFKCNKCYFAGSSGKFPCPCSERRSFVDSLGAFFGMLSEHNDVGEYDSDEEFY